MARGRIAITDNADPMNVVVYRRGARTTGSRLVCEQPVFRKGASATDNSLIAAAQLAGGGEQLRLHRADRHHRRGDHRAGPRAGGRPQERQGLPHGVAQRTRSPRASCPSCRWRPASSTPTPSRAAPTAPTPGTSRRSTSAPGRAEYRRLAGTGIGFNNNYAPVTLGPDGAAYVGVLGGLVRIADSVTPKGPARGTPRGCKFRPRLALKLLARRARRCLPRRSAPRSSARTARWCRRAASALGRRVERPTPRRPSGPLLQSARAPAPAWPGRASRCATAGRCGSARVQGCGCARPSPCVSISSTR